MSRTWPVETSAGASSQQALPGFHPTLLGSDTSHLEGISGWLILVVIGLVLSPLVILGGLIKTHLPLLVNVRFQLFLETHPALHGLILFEVATNLIFVAVLLALNFLFFTKKKAFPTYMILYLALRLVIVVGDTIAAHLLLPSVRSEGSYGEVSRTLITACVWIPYLLVSRRVKVTFVQ